jgi:peroxiredoxin
MNHNESNLFVSLGVDEVIIYCVNDGAVMDAWAKDQGVPEDSIIKLMGDPYGNLTDLLQMELTAMGPLGKGLVGRSKRFALYVEDGIVKIVRVAESEDVSLYRRCLIHCSFSP